MNKASEGFCVAQTSAALRAVPPFHLFGLLVGRSLLATMFRQGSAALAGHLTGLAPKPRIIAIGPASRLVVRRLAMRALALTAEVRNQLQRHPRHHHHLQRRRVRCVVTRVANPLLTVRLACFVVLDTSYAWIPRQSPRMDRIATSARMEVSRRPPLRLLLQRRQEQKRVVSRRTCVTSRMQEGTSFSGRARLAVHRLEARGPARPRRDLGTCTRRRQALAGLGTTLSWSSRQAH